MTTMRTIRVEEYGDEDKLKLKADYPIPKPSAGEVLVKVKAAGINPVDTYIRAGPFAGLQLPLTPGVDGAGIVEQVGESVTDFKKGDRVIFLFPPSGAYAEYCTVNASRVCALSESLSFTQGAAIGVPYYTAQFAIFYKANVKPGETVLVHGASGAVGIAAVQILKALGCTVIGTAGTQQGMDLVTEVGADKVFNHREKGYMQTIYDDVTHGKGVDVILEMLADANLAADLETAAVKGRIVIIGCRGACSVNMISTMMKEITIMGFALLRVPEESWKPMHEAIAEGQRKGWLKPRVAKSYKLDQVSKGHYDVINNSGTQGKLVIDMSL